MFDADLLFHNATVITAAGDSVALDLQKTPADGVPIEIVVTTLGGTSPTITFQVAESDSPTTGWVTNAIFPTITTTGRWIRRVQSKRRYLRLSRAAPGGTSPTFTVTAGIVSGHLIDTVA